MLAVFISPFQTYADWFYQQCHENQQKPLETNWHVDSDNGEVKVYSPKTCKLILPFDNIQKARKDKGKNISLVHTDGKILKDVKISEAVEKTGLNKSTVYRLINGKTSEVNGWKNKGDSFD
ncbi:hypothetical protein SM033_00256 [Vibrio phage vB_VpaM_sm033]|nr:hypothetical protein SM033_00256 [Vibrio phage vB_VpaM_sm033]